MPIIEMRDPRVDVEALNRRIAGQVGTRRERGAYAVNVAEVGPASLLPHRGSPGGENGAGSASAEFDSQLIDLMIHAGLEEPQFTSDVPYIGPLIVAFRRLWNWMSTKWYVLPLMRAQSDLNIKTSVLLSTLSRLQHDSAQEVLELRARVDELERLVRAQGRDES